MGRTTEPLQTEAWVDHALGGFINGFLTNLYPHKFCHTLNTEWALY